MNSIRLSNFKRVALFQEMSSVTTTTSIAPMGSIDWDSLAPGISSVIYQTKGSLPTVPMPAGHVVHSQDVELFSTDNTNIKMPQVLAHLATHVGSKTQLEVRSLSGDFSATAFAVGYYTNPLTQDSTQDLKYSLAQLSLAPHYMGVNPPQIIATMLPDIPLKYARGLSGRTQMGLPITGVIMEATLAFKTIDGKVLNDQLCLREYVYGSKTVQSAVIPVSPPPTATTVPAAPKKKVWRSPFATVAETSDGATIRNLDASLALAVADTAPKLATKIPLAPKKAERPSGQFDLSGALELMNITTTALEAAGGGGAESVCSSIHPHSTHELQVQEIPDGHAMCLTDGCIQTFAEDESIKRCLDCRKNRTRFIRPCKSQGCADFAYTSQEQMTEGKRKYGDSYQPFSRCFKHAKAHHDSAASEASAQEFVIEDNCATEECDGMVQLTAKEMAFYESKGLEFPVRCSECRTKRKEAKKTTVECECEACEETFSMPEKLKLSLEEQGKQITCMPCRTTTTRNCKNCNSGFLTLAQIAWSKVQYAAEGGEWHPPNYCCKECKASAATEVAHKEGASRGGKRAAK